VNWNKPRRIPLQSSNVRSTDLAAVVLFWNALILPERRHDGPRDGILTSGSLPYPATPTALEKQV